MDEKQKQILTIDSQIIALFFILGAVGALIYVTFAYRDILINEDKSSWNEKDLEPITENATLVFFVVAIYFFILAFDNYDKDNSTSNANYLTAATLSLAATGIRYYEAKKDPEDIEGVEDVV